MMFVVRYLWFSDCYYKFYLTQIGLYYTYEQIIPDSAYKVVRGFAWFGVAVCIVSVAIIGPMAFVGAGVCALLSFKMTGFQSQVRDSYVLFIVRNCNLTQDPNYDLLELYALDHHRQM